MFLLSFIIFIITLLLTLYLIKKKWFKILWFIAIIAFLAPFNTLYQAGVHTDWHFLGDELWIGVILFIIVDIPSIIILGVIAFKVDSRIFHRGGTLRIHLGVITFKDDSKNNENRLLSNYIGKMFMLQIVLHIIGIAICDWM